MNEPLPADRVIAMPVTMRFARTVFRTAGIYGLLVTFPLYFAEEKMGVDYPPPINHPEYFYSFIGVTLVWQILFFVIASDPLRYRKLMIISMLEKLSLVPAFVVLFPQGRFPLVWLPLMGADLILCGFFLAAYILTREKQSSSPGP